MDNKQAEEVLGLKPGELANLAKLCASPDLLTDVVSVAHSHGVRLGQERANERYREMMTQGGSHISMN